MRKIKTSPDKQKWKEFGASKQDLKEISKEDFRNKEIGLWARWRISLFLCELVEEEVRIRKYRLYLK